MAVGHNKEVHMGRLSHCSRSVATLKCRQPRFRWRSRTASRNLRLDRKIFVAVGQVVGWVEAWVRFAARAFAANSMNGFVGCHRMDRCDFLRLRRGSASKSFRLARSKICYRRPMDKLKASRHDVRGIVRNSDMDGLGFR